MIATGCDDAEAATAPRVDYAATGLYAAPFPDERLRGPDGRVDLRAFVEVADIPIAGQLKALLERATGFAQSAAIHFALTGPLDPTSLPGSPLESARNAASVVLLDAEAGSADYGGRQFIRVGYEADGGTYGAPYLLSLLPVQGRPLRPNHLYMAVVKRAVRDAEGAPLGVGAGTADLLAEVRPEGLSEAAYAFHQTALMALSAAGIDRSEVAATAVFRTWDATAELRAAQAQLAAEPAPPLAAWALDEVFPTYCVFRSAVEMPVFQAGTPPYQAEGGAWVRDESGRLVEQRKATSTVYLTLPRQPMPSGGFPVTVLPRVGFGQGARPLVDRGPRDASGAQLAPGTGPALHFAQAGTAGLSVDGPLGGQRNLAQWDEQFLIFNIINPAALKHNVLQSALELSVTARLVETLSLDASACPGLGASPVSLDEAHVSLMGHSMGASIAPLAAAVDARFGALILSGAGASWIENVLEKELPTATKPLAEAVIGYAGDEALDAFDPALNLLQWAGEPADVQLYGRRLVRGVGTTAGTPGAPPHVLMFQGVIDRYIPPPVANALTLSLELDLAGPALDEDKAGVEPITTLLPLSGRQVRALPASGNRGASTAVLVQYPPDGIEDGHEVVFQSPEPKTQLSCFLQRFAAGVPEVVDPATGCGL